MKHNWRKTAQGNYVSPDGAWKLRKITFGLGRRGGKVMWWLYNGKTHTRYTPTGKYDDAVNFPSVVAGIKFVNNLKGGYGTF